MVTSGSTYDIDSPAVFVTDALLGLPMNMALVSPVSGVRADLGQSLQSMTRDIVCGEFAGILEGVIEADATGGPFDFRVRCDYSSVSSGRRSPSPACRRPGLRASVQDILCR